MRSMKTAKALRALTLVLACSPLGLWSCGAGTSSAFDRLPESSRATYDRCWEHMRIPICGSTSDMATVLNCARSSSATYAAYPTDAEREAWLASHGCPQPVISSGGQR